MIFHKDRYRFVPYKKQIKDKDVEVVEIRKVMMSLDDYMKLEEFRLKRG